MSRNDRGMARADIEALTQRSTELIDRVERETTDDERMRKPAPAAWSLTEVTQHLALVTGGMLRTARPSGRSAPLLDKVKTSLLTGILRSRMKMRVPVAGIVPRTGVTWTDARTHVLGSLDRWKAFVDGDTFDDTGFMHPLVGRLTPAQTARFLVEHFEHHMRQVDRLFAGLKGA